ncbi:2-C-methyl-D-erythritol 4-phosphate cytidylyltransferase [Rubrivirga sp. IMCC43871]|uniref:2-C-methyl-D-erythritol 4-phosphate cytidylyltransferase n=1 Tax=Rubrivirga sp. IMCC43871 TaxID=3391575 RepID=UPI0039901B44
MSGDPTVGLVLPAGGSGSRMAQAGAPAKQFRVLGGAPVVVQTLRAFASHPVVGPLVVVVPAGEEASTRDLLAEHGVAADVATGGRTRQASVANGVLALPASVETVVVHDAVRPFVTRSVIAKCVMVARQHGAAASALRVADTLRQGGDGPFFGDTVSRDGLWAMQTPQAARRDWLTRAAANAAGHLATDEVGLLHHAGYPVRIVEGDPRTLKITRPGDWALAQALWPGWTGE